MSRITTDCLNIHFHPFTAPRHTFDSPLTSSPISRQNIMAAEDNSKRMEEAKKLSKDQPQKAEQIYKGILSKEPGSNDKAAREFESALMGLGELYRDHKRTQDLANLIHQTRDVLTSFARAKTAKLSMSIHQNPYPRPC